MICHLKELSQASQTRRKERILKEPQVEQKVSYWCFYGPVWNKDSAFVCPVQHILHIFLVITIIKPVFRQFGVNQWNLWWRTSKGPAELKSISWWTEWKEIHKINSPNYDPKIILQQILTTLRWWNMCISSISCHNLSFKAYCHEVNENEKMHQITSSNYDRKSFYGNY